MTVYDVAAEFARLFGQYEHSLKRNGFQKKKSKVAEADWEAYAAALSEDFFEHVNKSDIARTLIDHPPRKLMADLTWLPEKPFALTSVDDLFVRGVCRVRNSYIHGEKFVGGPDGENWERDGTLVFEALAVLKEAAGRIPGVAPAL